MTDLRPALNDYLTLRRSLGFQLEREGHLLPRFVAYLKEQGSPFITTTHALAWAMEPRSASPKWWAYRLRWVRGLARYVRAIDPRTEIPPSELLPFSKSKHPPHLYSENDLSALLRAAGELRGSLRPCTYRTLISLLAVTGMRVGEALALDRGDVDEPGGVLTIRHAKFRKSREVALHPTSVAALQAYAAARDRIFPRSASKSFFVSQHRTRLLYQNVQSTFFRLVEAAGLGGSQPRPRIHDLRHSFAMRTLIEWYRAEGDVERRLPLLSTYLGHVSPSSTYWYLTAVPELVGAAAKRLEASLGVLP